MKQITLLLFITLFANACDLNQKDKTVVVKDKFSLSVPVSLTKQLNLHEDASLQYGNLLNELYVIVIDESKAEFHAILEDNELSDSYSADINGYSRIIIERFDENIENLEKSQPVDTTINNMPATLITLSGTVEGMDVFYSYAFLEGKENYYQVITWTLENKKKLHSKAMHRMVRSLKEL